MYLVIWVNEDQTLNRIELSMLDDAKAVIDMLVSYPFNRKSVYLVTAPCSDSLAVEYYGNDK